MQGRWKRTKMATKWNEGDDMYWNHGDRGMQGMIGRMRGGGEEREDAYLLIVY